MHLFNGQATFAGDSHDRIDLLYDGSGREAQVDGKGWMIDMPTVLAMLAACERGQGSAAGMRTTLLSVLAGFSERSGCCPECDVAVDDYARALQRYEQQLEQEQRERAAMTPESHPFVLSGAGKVHAWNCSSNPGRSTVHHPGLTLQQYVHGLGTDDADLTAGRGTWMTAEELTVWLGRRRAAPRRCKLCEPVLPGAYGSQASGVEAGARG